jgi:adenosine deaminase
MSVLRTEQDFFELCEAYFRRAREAGVVHAELFFDPQAHTGRGVAFETVLGGLWESVRASRASWGITSRLIMCFLRDLSEDDALATFERALPFADRLGAVGLDSAEVGNPPQKFARVYARARAEGWRAVAHAGEEGPPQYVTDSLDILHVERIDHGIRSLEDERLVARLRDERIPLTVCPLSNVRLRAVDRLADHPLRAMLDAGLCATVNSDDPAYFGGYVDDNFAGVRDALGLDDQTLVLLARNGFEAAFLDTAERRGCYDRLAAFTAAHGLSARAS